ncbi:MAG TPA: extracellular solute-binding protein [Bradyrhizobium sp.]|uniref:extracellular solute-binding protein n=1 Tax=Bradyrhizobium sp. TaxID=376 RepID=UPI002BC38846|nr:extracellular solute-binding protein [Bradyrhizobium sp.]HLZ04119.1 extracellular solute-binding protein [Bradyrhizobium sp.]
MSSKPFPRVTRRRFLKQTGLTIAAAGGAPLISAPFVSSAWADTKTLSIVQWSHFVPAYDKWFDQFAKDWGEKNKIAVTIDHIPVANVAARAAAEASAGSGHDLFGWNGAGGAHLYRKFLVDVTKLVQSVEKKHGKATTIGRQIAYNQDDHTWSAFPDYYINFPVMYRKSLWDGIGVKPDSWDDIRVGGAKLKAKGNPVGISLGHSNDPENTWRGVLWSYGGHIQDESGKKVVLNSKETVEAVKFAAALYKEAMTTDVLSWNDASNNQYIDSGVSSLIINPISAYRTAQQLNKQVADDIFVLEAPKGPVRRLMAGAPEFYGIWKFSKNQDAAIAFLEYYSDHWVDAFKASTGYNMPIFANLVPKPMPILSDDPTSTPHDKLAVLQNSDQWSAAIGYPGPSWPATDEIYNNFIVSDMMAKAATGAMSPEDSVKWAHQQCEAVFNKWLHKA